MSITPDTRQLKRFGFLMAAVVGGLLGVVPFLRGHFRPLPLFIGCAFLGFSLVAPHALKHVYRIWMQAGALLGKVNSFLILTFIYAVIFVPVGILFRCLGRDPLSRKLDPDAVTYKEAIDRSIQTSMERIY